MSQTLPEPTTAPAEPALTVRERLAAELHRIADDIVRLELPLKDTMGARLGVGVLASRADLERWAAYLGSTIKVDQRSDIPSTTRTLRLDGTPGGADLTISAQTHPEPQGQQLEAALARVAELEAQLAAGGTR